jgi:hypothetical protein
MLLPGDGDARDDFARRSQLLHEYHFSPHGLHPRQMNPMMRSAS